MIERTDSRPSTRPYASILASALNMGLSLSECRSMAYTTLTYVVGEWGDMNTPDSDDVVRTATQADINALLH